MNQRERAISPEDQAMVDRMAKEVDTRPPLHLTISPMQAIRLAGLLQLAGRHEKVEGDFDHAYAIRWFVHHVKLHFDGCPATLECLERGNHREFDRT